MTCSNSLASGILRLVNIRARKGPVTCYVPLAHEPIAQDRYNRNDEEDDCSAPVCSSVSLRHIYAVPLHTLDDKVVCQGSKSAKNRSRRQETRTDAQSNVQHDVEDKSDFHDDLCERSDQLQNVRMVPQATTNDAP